jgi:proteasome accessory factor C
MADTAADQLRRILALIPELADDEAHPIEPLAAELGVSRDTLLADLRALTERFDDPAGFVDEGIALFIERDRIALTSPHFRRPMRLTAGELHALDLGLAMLEAERPPEEHRAIGRARERLRAVMTRLPGAAEEEAHTDAVLRHAELAAVANPGHLHAVREAMRCRVKLRIRYRRGGVEAATTRVVCPYALVVASGTWYLAALCEESAGVRVFRLDRLEAAAVLDAPYTVPPTFALKEIVRDGRVFNGPVVRTMTVRYSPRIARWIAEREGRPLAGDGSLTVDRPLADADWAVRHVLQYGPDAEVVAPDAMRAAVAGRLAALLGGGTARATADAPSTGVTPHGDG